MAVFIAVLLAFALEYKFSEPKRFHPLIGFGHWAHCIEGKMRQTLGASVASGFIAWCFTVLPWLSLAFIFDQVLHSLAFLHLGFMALALYLAIGWRSLIHHAQAVQTPLAEQDLPAARYHVSMIVSRQTQSMNEHEIAVATTESVLENGADAIFSAVFWFLVLGVPGVVLYRLSNTLDAMWGYKNEKYLSFGKVAARIDDALNYIPARLTAILYTLASFSLTRGKQALQCWRRQARHCSSPNGGPVMCAGAGAINVTLGGQVNYHGQLLQKPAMGVAESDASPAQMISRACGLVNSGVGLLLGMIVLAILLRLLAS